MKNATESKLIPLIFISHFVPYEKDTEFLALAIAYKCSIWSDDKDFNKQDRIRIYTSNEIIEKMIGEHDR